MGLLMCLPESQYVDGSATFTVKACGPIIQKALVMLPHAS